jgi:hypothetical protein
MNWKRKHIKTVRLLVGLALLLNWNRVAMAQSQPGYLHGKAAIGDDITLIVGDYVIFGTGELFLGCHETSLQKKNTLFKVGNFNGKTGAKIHLSIIDNSNNHGSRGFFNVVGTAIGSTEIVPDMFLNWNGSPIDLIRAHNAGSDNTAFTMQEGVYNGRTAQLRTRVEGNDRIWFIAEKESEGDCLPLIFQKKNHTLAVDNNAMSNGGYNFDLYKWFKNNELIHEGASGQGLGGIYNTGGTNLNPSDTYHALVTDQNGKEHRLCNYNPMVFVQTTRIIAYPNPTATYQSLVVVDVETNDEELLANGVIMVFNMLGQSFGQKRTNGHRITPIQLPAIAGMYILRFVSGEFEKTIRVVVK